MKINQDYLYLNVNPNSVINAASSQSEHQAWPKQPKGNWKKTSPGALERHRKTEGLSLEDKGWTLPGEEKTDGNRREQQINRGQRWIWSEKEVDRSLQGRPNRDGDAEVPEVGTDSETTANRDKLDCYDATQRRGRVRSSPNEAQSCFLQKCPVLAMCIPPHMLEGVRGSGPLYVGRRRKEYRPVLAIHPACGPLKRCLVCQ